MALSIRTNESSILSSTQSSEKASSGSNLGNLGQVKINSPQSVDEVQLSSREKVSERTSQRLFSAGLSITLKQNETEKLTEVTQNLLTQARKVKAEVNPEKRQSLVDEANEIVLSANEDYEQTVEENPGVAQNEEVLSLVRPGADSNDANKTVSTTIIAAPSPTSLGLNSLSFSAENIDQTIQTLEQTQSTLANYSSAYTSASSAIAQTVKKEVAYLSSVDKANSQVSLEDRVTSLAEEIRTAANLNDLPKTEAMNVEKLLTQGPAAPAQTKDPIKQEPSESTEVQKQSDPASLIKALQS